MLHASRTLLRPTSCSGKLVQSSMYIVSALGPQRPRQLCRGKVNAFQPARRVNYDNAVFHGRKRTRETETKIAPWRKMDAGAIHRRRGGGASRVTTAETTIAELRRVDVHYEIATIPFNIHARRCFLREHQLRLRGRVKLLLLLLKKKKNKESRCTKMASIVSMYIHGEEESRPPVI